MVGDTFWHSTNGQEDMAVNFNYNNFRMFMEWTSSCFGLQGQGTRKTWRVKEWNIIEERYAHGESTRKSIKEMEEGH